MIPSLTVWLVATALHFALTVQAVARRLPPGDASRDERIFAAVLGGVASLALVLHVAALTVGLSLISGIAVLAVWHVTLGRLTHTSRASGASAGSLASWDPMETLAGAVAAAILLSWVAIAAASGDVLGPDAAHYHVPYAVNLAAGASPFALPATPHLYPMAGSMVAAWFIVPLGDPLIVDLAMALPFLLLAASLNMIFRAATGLSGTAWASWLTLALFSLPLFRMSSLGSADLWFASSFVSLIAVLLRVWWRHRWDAANVLLAGSALGLLVGSKTTGAPAAVLIVAAAIAVAGVRRLSGGTPISLPARWPWLVLVSAVLAAGSGGVWLIRNWVEFGSPIAPSGLAIGGLTIFAGEPFQRSTYLSVLGELDTDSFHLWPRAQYFVAAWLGPWFLAALWPIALLVADLAYRPARRRTDDRWWPRAGLLLLTLGVGAALVWMLIGAPWTGLERSRGLTLRYALPLAALLPLLSFAAWFPLGLRWPEQPIVKRALQLLVATASLLIFWRSLGVAGPQSEALPLPGLEGQWLLAAVLAAATAHAASRRSNVATRAIIALCGIGLIAWSVRVVAGGDVAAHAKAEARLAAEERTRASGVKPTDIWRDVYLTVRAAEGQAGHLCGSSRFFALTRFDEPLALQPPGFGNQVYYAPRDVDAARRAGPMGSCDYVLSTPAVSATDKGQALMTALAGGRRLRPFASTADFVVWTVIEN